MKLNDDLQNYLAQSSGKTKTSNGVRPTSGLLTFWNSRNSDTTDGSGAESGSNGWFSSMKIPLLSQQAQSDAGNQSKIEKLCSCFPTLGHRQRLVGFGMSMVLGITLFSLAAMNIPFLLLRARKFALLFTMGSVAVVCSIGFLIGPANYLTHFLSRDRLMLTTTYFSSLMATLYSSLVLQSTLLTVPFSLIQVLALLWLLVSYIPGGQTGLRFMTNLFRSAVKRSVSQTLPV